MLTRKFLLQSTAIVGVIVALGCGQRALDNAAQAQGKEAPLFEVDPFWPKPLPNHWILGMTIGLAIDSRDHVYIVHRRDTFNERTEIGAATDPKTGDCCMPAPNILEFDPAGNLVNHWGGPGDGYTWPSSNHGVTIDHKDNIWIGGNGPTDSHILKFTKDGRFLQQFGEAGLEADSHSSDHFAGVAEIAFDADANEAYVADGYRNKRVAVLDADSGELKRFWGAYGNEPTNERPDPYTPGETPPQQFRTPVHCAELSNDDLLYVCDRPSNRISIFQKDGTFVSEHIFAPQTLAQGSTWDIDFSPDPEQTWIYLADGQNMKVYVIRRETMEVVYSFGDGGRQPGLWFAVHSIAVDSEGNIFTTETYEGKRVQKFNYMGLGEASGDMGAAWPAERRRSDN